MSNLDAVNLNEPKPGYNVPSLPSRVIGYIARPETITVVLLFLAFVFCALGNEHFRDAEYLFSSTSLYMETGLMALAMTFVIISGNIDLSVASALALTSAVCATLFSKFHLPPVVVVCLAPFIGIALGLFNGLLITAIGLPSLTVTLGTLALYRGLAQVLLGDHSVGGWPEWFIAVDRRLVGIVPMPLIVLIVFALVFAFILHKTTFGRTVYAIGANEQAARFSGLRVDRTKLIVFGISGLMSGLGAMVMLSRLQYARYDFANGIELAVITAVVLGGTDIFGGRGTIFGTIVALFLLGILRTGMDLARVTPEKQMAVVGTLLILAVVLANLATRFRGRRRRG